MFPPFQIGIDIVSINRMREICQRQGKRFIDRVFTKAEQDYCETKRNKFESYASRFAAKEAFVKAIRGGQGRFSFRQIEVTRNSEGMPSLQVSSSMRKLFKIPANTQFEITMAHEREFAVAVVAMVTPQ
jgi:holo-[acyl-carrier protein] synthase